MATNLLPTPYRKYLISIGIAGLFSWAAFWVVIFKLDPYQSTALALFFFFLSLFFALTTTFTFIGFYVRKWFSKNEIYFRHINISLRQGALLSFCALGCLFFLLLGVLTWWNGLLLVVIITLLEFYFTSKE